MIKSIGFEDNLSSSINLSSIKFKENFLIQQNFKDISFEVNLLNNLQDFNLIDLNDSCLRYFKDLETIDRSIFSSDLDLNKWNLTEIGFYYIRNI
jgi:hypothetical protein